MSYRVSIGLHIDFTKEYAVDSHRSHTSSVETQIVRCRSSGLLDRTGYNRLCVQQFVQVRNQYVSRSRAQLGTCCRLAFLLCGTPILSKDRVCVTSPSGLSSSSKNYDSSATTVQHEASHTFEHDEENNRSFAVVRIFVCAPCRQHRRSIMART